MKIPPLGRQSIKNSEGLRQQIYDDKTGKPWLPGQPIRGYLTVGYGHKLTPREIKASKWFGNKKIPIQEIEALFEKDIAIFENGLSKHVPVSVEVRLTDRMKSALGAFVFNIGIGHFAGSTSKAKLLAGDMVGCALAMMLFVRDDDGLNRGLVTRRETEAKMFLEDV
jgi:GH24 family phage-related lysozyme (muramidase)